MKPLKILSVSALCFMLISICFFPVSVEAQEVSPGTASVDEEIPPVGPDAIFPAVVARVDGKPILGRDLEVIVHRELAPIGNPEWTNLREDYRGQLTLAALNVLPESVDRDSLPGDSSIPDCRWGPIHDERLSLNPCRG